MRSQLHLTGAPSGRWVAIANNCQDASPRGGTTSVSGGPLPLAERFVLLHEAASAPAALPTLLTSGSTSEGVSVEHASTQRAKVLPTFAGSVEAAAGKLVTDTAIAVNGDDDSAAAAAAAAAAEMAAETLSASAPQQLAATSESRAAPAGSRSDMVQWRARAGTGDVRCRRGTLVRAVGAADLHAPLAPAAAALLRWLNNPSSSESAAAAAAGIEPIGSISAGDVPRQGEGRARTRGPAAAGRRMLRRCAAMHLAAAGRRLRAPWLCARLRRKISSAGGRVTMPRMGPPPPPPALLRTRWYARRNSLAHC